MLAGYESTSKGFEHRTPAKKTRPHYRMLATCRLQTCKRMHCHRRLSCPPGSGSRLLSQSIASPHVRLGCSSECFLPSNDPTCGSLFLSFLYFSYNARAHVLILQASFARKQRLPVQGVVGLTQPILIRPLCAAFVPILGQDLTSSALQAPLRQRDIGIPLSYGVFEVKFGDEPHRES